MQMNKPWKLLFSRQYRPELLVGSLVAFFSQINVRLHVMSCSKSLLSHFTLTIHNFFFVRL